MAPAAPARLSTMTCCPQRSVSFAAMARAVMSVPPPGTKGAMSRTGLAGYLSTSTDAACAMWMPAHAAVSASILLLRLIFEVIRDHLFSATGNAPAFAVELHRAPADGEVSGRL